MSKRRENSFLNYYFSGWNIDVPVLDLVVYGAVYLYRRLRQLLVFSYAIFEVLVSIFNDTKVFVVSRMFWGRGSWYRNSFHVLVMVFTIVAFGGGIAGRLMQVNAARDSLQIAYGQGPSADLLQQGSSIQTVLPVDPSAPDVQITEYVVAEGDTLAAIAEFHGVSIDTIRWANSELISPFSNEIRIGWRLKIPQMDGVLYKVRSGQNLDQIVAITGGNRSDIIELNQLVPPDYNLQADQRLFIPNGNLGITDVVVAGIPTGVFENPLSHPACAGYSYSRGYTGWHDGIDLARYPGCPIRSIATGIVTFAGWSPLAGFNVRVDHGGGIVSKYYHGDGTFWVSAGDRVQQGQEIMMMGTSGNSTGVHLHISLFKDNIAVNPVGFIPF